MIRWKNMLGVVATTIGLLMLLLIVIFGLGTAVYCLVKGIKLVWES